MIFRVSWSCDPDKQSSMKNHAYIFLAQESDIVYYIVICFVSWSPHALYPIWSAELAFYWLWLIVCCLLAMVESYGWEYTVYWLFKSSYGWEYAVYLLWLRVLVENILYIGYGWEHTVYWLWLRVYCLLVMVESSYGWQYTVYWLWLRIYCLLVMVESILSIGYGWEYTVYWLWLRVMVEGMLSIGYGWE